MKKMKKSLVVVPALARIARTTVASISGTVAWFTANRAVTVSTNKFTAYDESRGLNIVAENLAGVKVVDENVVEPLGVLTDGSFDFTNVWTDVPNTAAEGAAPTDFKKAESPFKSGTTTGAAPDTKEVYYAVQWKYTISLANQDGTLAKPIDVLFDESSSFEVDASTGTSTEKGFRIARTCGDSQFVFSNGTEKKHIGAKADNADQGEEKTWEETDYITSLSSYAKLADGVNHKSANEYLGTFTNSTDTLTITCTAWYEGTDSAVVSGNAMSSVGATLKFYSRNAA